jgi:glycosyltransferase involved in cell wall biosynthesis
LQGAELESFYRGARFLVVPSLWFETFGLVVGEAMSHGIPVIASRIGALAELVEDGRTGLLFSPGAADELAAMMLRLWNEPEFCHQLGMAGREKILRLSHPDVYYAGLIRLYEKALGRMS